MFTLLTYNLQKLQDLANWIGLLADSAILIIPLEKNSI